MKMMLNALNWAGFVSPLLWNRMVLGEYRSINAFSCLARQEGIKTNTLNSKVLADLFGKLSFILIQ